MSSQTLPTHQKGKLSSVSKAVKQRAFKTLHVESDVSDSPSGHTAGQRAVNKTSGRKRKSNDDDDFVPRKSRPKRTNNIQQKRKPVAGVDGKKLRPRADMHHSSAASSRHALIDGLLGATQTTVRAPRAPVQPRTGSPKTPTRPRIPTEVRVPLVSSSLLVSLADDQPSPVQNTGAGIEMLSSNSKPTPASPNAESTAISGHVNYEDLAREKRKGDIRTFEAKEDPFRQQRDRQKATSFTRRLTGDGSSIGQANQPIRPDKGELGVGMKHSVLVAAQEIVDGIQVEEPARETRSAKEGQTFLHSQDTPPVAVLDVRIINENGHIYLEHANSVGPEDNTNIPKYNSDERTANVPEALPVRFRSSPSSHSSTSAEPELIAEPSLAEEMEWEASLQPHQRILHELLVRTSKRVMRHIVDNETAVIDIIHTFARDGKYVLDALLQRHDGNYGLVFSNMAKKRDDLQKELEHAVRYIASERILVDAII